MNYNLRKQVFYSNGKLLLTSEYLVLKGAGALAIPLRFGQEMIVESASKSLIIWTSEDINGIWFESEFDIHTFRITSCTDIKIAEKLVQILKACKKLKPIFCTDENGYIVKTVLNFNRFWGLGSSSTLISNIAEWVGVDPYLLLSNTFGGSGYDIACARASQPIIFQLIEGKAFVDPVDFKPNFHQNLFFLYLGQKQSTSKEIIRFNKKYQLAEEDISNVNELTNSFLIAEDVDSFILLMEKHEQLISKAIGIIPIKELLFKDFEGGIKSLGAWGGDFALIATKLSKNEVYSYFKSKGYNTIFEFQEMIK